MSISLPIISLFVRPIGIWHFHSQDNSVEHTIQIEPVCLQKAAIVATLAAQLQVTVCKRRTKICNNTGVHSAGALHGNKSATSAVKQFHHICTPSVPSGWCISIRNPNGQSVKICRSHAALSLPLHHSGACTWAKMMHGDTEACLNYGDWQGSRFLLYKRSRLRKSNGVHRK